MRTLLLLTIIAVASALGVVYTKYHSRMLFVEAQRLEQELNAYQEEWEQLQAEQNTLAEHSRIEKLARSRLDMVLPARESIIYLQP